MKRTKVNCEICKSFLHTTNQHKKRQKKILTELKNSKPKLHSAKTFSVPKVKHISGEKIYSSELHGAEQ